MITIKFHKALLPYTNGLREVSLERDTYFHTFRNCLNLFPALERLTKQLGNNKLQDLVLIANGRVLTYEELLFLPSDNSTIFIVPSFSGGFDPVTLLIAGLAFLSSTIMSLAQGYDLGTALFRGVLSAGFTLLGVGLGGLTGSIIGQAIIGAAVSTLGSMVINALTGPPPMPNSDAADAGSRQENDVFNSLTNTTGEGAVVPLNYGMLRVGGYFISADIETVTLQRFPDPVDDDLEQTIIENVSSAGDNDTGTGGAPDGGGEA